MKITTFRFVLFTMFGLVFVSGLFGQAGEASLEEVVPVSGGLVNRSAPGDVVNNIIRAVKEGLKNELMSELDNVLREKLNAKIGGLVKLLTSGLSISNLNFDINVKADELSLELKELLMKALFSC